MVDVTDSRGVETTIEAGGRSYSICLPHAATDYIQSKLLETARPYEERMLEVMAAALVPGELVVDVGANIGNHALYLAVVAGCRVVAYEPNGDLVDGLRRSVAANRLDDRVVIRQAGVYSRPAFGVMADLDPANLGAQSIAVSDDGGDFEVVALDDESFDARVAALKIDVEGAELEVLRGARELIARDRPLMFVECGQVGEFRDVCEFMDGIGYSLVGTYNLTPTHAFRPAGGTREEREVVGALVEATVERYGLGSLKVSLRRDLERARQGARAANEELAAAESELARVRDRAGSLERHVAELEGDVAALRSDVVSAQADARALTDERELLIAQHGQLRARLRRSRSRTEELRSTLIATRVELRAVKQSRAYRVASRLSRAVRGPFGSVPPADGVGTNGSAARR